MLVVLLFWAHCVFTSAAVLRLSKTSTDNREHEQSLKLQNMGKAFENKSRLKKKVRTRG